LTCNNGDNSVVKLNGTNSWSAEIEKDSSGVCNWNMPNISGYESNIINNVNSTIFELTRNSQESEAQEHTLTIYYRHLDRTEAAPQYSVSLLEGNQYDIPSPVIPNYVATPSSIKGFMPGRDKEYTVIYVPE